MKKRLDTKGEKPVNLEKNILNDGGSARKYNYDLLRVVAMIAVIMIHVSDSWIKSYLGYVSTGGSAEELLYPMRTCIYNSISRFAVPCFIMLTGAFVLADSRTGNYKEFYQKKLKKIGVPTIIFSALYILYRVPFCFVGESAGMKNVLSIIKDIIVGAPFFHMWYLYMLIGIYCLAPIVVRFKDSIKYETFRKIVFIFLILGSLSRWTTENVRLHWDIGQSFEYLGYFMVGYVLRKDLQKNTGKGILLIIGGVVIEMATAFLEYKIQVVNGISASELKYGIVTPSCPLIVVASLLFFAGFTMLKVGYNAWIEKLALCSFTIYLFHGGVWDFIQKLVNLIKGKNYIMTLDNTYWIPIFTVMVLVVSFLCTIIYEKVEVCIIAKGKKRRGTE